MVTRRVLTADANQRLRAGDLENAQRGLIALVRAAPHDLDARLRIADGLLAAGSNAGALASYAFVAREAALAGYPLKDLVALKVLARIDPSVNELLAALATRYAAGAPTLGRAVRLTPPDPDAEVPGAAFIPNELPADSVYELASQVATSREALPGWPATVAPIPLLSDLPPEAFAEMLAATRLQRLASGEVVVQEGEPGDAFFMVARGSVRVTRRAPQALLAPGGRVDQEQVLATLGEGSIFGEMALISAAPRTATVTAAEDTDVLVFGREALAAVAQQLAVVGAALERFTTQRLLGNLLATHPLFKPFDRAQRQQLAARFSAHDAMPATVLIREGEAGRGLFLLLAGEVDVTKLDGTDRVMLASLKSGDVFGEIALIENGPTTATVTAARRSKLLFLAREVFERLVQGVPELRAYFEQLAEDRRMDTNLVLASSREAAGLTDVAQDERVLV
jgi:cAMP-dependent protein kinase regulator